MNSDPKKIAEETSAKASEKGANVIDQAKEKVGDVVDQVKEKAGGVTDTIKEKAADAIAKGADMLDGLADKLKS